MSLIELEAASVTVTVAVVEAGILVLPEIMLASVNVGLAVGVLGPDRLVYEVETPSIRGCSAHLRVVLDWQEARLALFARADHAGTWLEVEDGLPLGADALGIVHAAVTASDSLALSA